MGANVCDWPQPVPQIQALERLGCRIERRAATGLLPRVRQKLLPTWACRWLDRFKPGHVVLSLGFHGVGLEWMQECARRGIAYSVLVQAAGENVWPEDGAAQELAQAYRQAARCLFVSRSNRDLVQTQMATTLDNAQVVRNPFNVSYEAAPPWPEKEDVVRLACVGRLDPRAKGQDMLFEVLRDPKWRQRPLEVTLFGDGPMERQLSALARLYGLRGVTIGGFSADIEALWASHHALVLPSRHEGLPIVIVEAMLCGRPCIVTDVAGNAELMEDNVSGFVAAAPRAAFLDEAMERAWQRRAEWRQIGQAAARRVRTLVPPDPAAVFTEELLQWSAKGDGAP